MLRLITVVLLSTILSFSADSQAKLNSKEIPFVLRSDLKSKWNPSIIPGFSNSSALINSRKSIPDHFFAQSYDLNQELSLVGHKVTWPDQQESSILRFDNTENLKVYFLLEISGPLGSGMIYQFYDDLNTFKRYDASDLSPNGLLLTQPSRATEIYLSHDRASDGTNVQIEIKKIYWSDRLDAYQSAMIDTGFMASYPCHENINCSIGSGLEEEKDGVVRVQMVLEEGIGWCTGALVNNTAQDERPLILTAFHCQDTYTPIYELWRFDFNFESSTCSDPVNEPSKISVTGSTFRAGLRESDFLLLEMNQPVPPNTNAYFLGWNRDRNYIPSSAFLLHHPAGDIKKIAKENNDVDIHNGVVNWNNGTQTPPEHHFRMDLETGTHQPGSSGCPMLDQDGLLVGQLHGGVTDDEACDLAISYSGRLAISWDTASTADTRLKDWLDPLNTNTLTLMGKSQEAAQEFSLTGSVTNPLGNPIPDVIVTINGEGQQSVFTDAQGQFLFNSLQTGSDYTLSFQKIDAASNGVSSLDMVQTINHLLGFNTFSDQFSVFAADVTGDSNISGLDLVQMRNVILSIWTEFPNKVVWQFEPSVINVDEFFNPQNAIEITGYKTGDVNFSANLGN